MTKLRDCPFCGSDGVALWYHGTRYGRIAYAECDLCGAKSKAFAYYDRGDEFNSDDIGARKARNAWNRRTE